MERQEEIDPGSACSSTGRVGERDIIQQKYKCRAQWPVCSPSACHLPPFSLLHSDLHGAFTDLSAQWISPSISLQCDFKNWATSFGILTRNTFYCYLIFHTYTYVLIVYETLEISLTVLVTMVTSIYWGLKIIIKKFVIPFMLQNLKGTTKTAYPIHIPDYLVFIPGGGVGRYF